MSRAPQDIVLKPIITEASMAGVADKKYTFKVDKKANKYEIKAAVEALFDVKVKAVNTLNVKGHKRNYGRFTGYRPSWKKAIVTLTSDSDPIEFFDGMY